MKMMRYWLLIAALAVPCALLAAPAPQMWEEVYSDNGTWNAQLAVINEVGHIWFQKEDGSKIDHFKIDKANPQKYGMDSDQYGDFDKAYTLVLTTAKNDADPNFVSKTCVFVISAKGVDPDIRPLSYNGATCTWKSNPGVGINYYVS